MEHFKGVDAQERFNNDLLNETRHMNSLLEQLVQLLQPKIEKGPTKVIIPKRTQKTQRKQVK